MLEAEGKLGWGLMVGLDETGGFSMEFVEKKQKDDRTFQCDDVPDVQLFAVIGHTLQHRRLND